MNQQIKRIKIFGPPGTGKTTYLINKIIEFNQAGIPLSQMAFVSLTNAAINELKERLIKLGFGDWGSEDFTFFRTLHSINCHGLSIDTKNQIANFKIGEFKKEYKWDLGNNLIALQKKKVDYFDELADSRENGADDELLMAMNRVRNFNRNVFNSLPRTIQQSGMSERYFQFIRDYFNWMKKNNYVDFIGMVEKGIAENFIPDVQMLFVDEWQDLTPLQSAQIKIWSENIPLSYHAGDDDQAIYSFAGADSKLFLDFICDEKVFLKQSHRLPLNIFNASRFIEENKIREKKEFYPNKEGGIANTNMNLYDCFSFIQDHIKESWYVLVRNHFLKPFIKQALIEDGLPVFIPKEIFNVVSLMAQPKEKFDFSDIKLLISSIFPSKLYWKKGSKKALEEKLSKNEIIEVMPLELIGFGANPLLLEDIKNGNLSNLKIKVKERIPDVIYLEYVRKMIAEYGNNYNPIGIMTIHASKGREADGVLLLRDMAKRSYDEEQEGDKEAETRVWYVGSTRARKYLLMCDKPQFVARGTNIVPYLSKE